MVQPFDPSRIKKLLPGKVLVEIVEVLGGMKSNGLFYLPEDHAGKDTFMGRVLKMGPPPRIKHVKTDPRSPGWDVTDNDSGDTWSEEAMSAYGVGDIVTFPRDVPLVFHHEDVRYAIVLLHEAIFAVSEEDFQKSELEVVPWTPPQPGS